MKVTRIELAPLTYETIKRMSKEEAAGWIGYIIGERFNRLPLPPGHTPEERFVRTPIAEVARRISLSMAYNDLWQVLGK